MPEWTASGRARLPHPAMRLSQEAAERPENAGGRNFSQQVVDNSARFGGLRPYITSRKLDEVMRMFTNESWLRSEPAATDLLERRYLVPDGTQADIHTTLGDDGWQQRTIRLTSAGKLSYDGQIDENLMRLLELCRKDQRPAGMVAELRAEPQFHGIPDLEARIVALTRELLSFALITPV